MNTNSQGQNPDQESQALPEHLFDLSEYHLALAKFMYDAIDEVRDRMFPLLGKIQKVKVETLHHTSVTVASGEVVESAPIRQQFPFFVDLKGAVAGDLSPLFNSIGETALEKGRFEMRTLEDYMSRVMDAAGTSFNAEGKKVSRELFLQMMETYDIEFDEEGYPELSPEVRHLFHDSSQPCTCFTDGRFPQYVLHTSQRVKDYLAQMPPPSSEELMAFKALMEKKRREFNDRKRHRQLSQ